MHPAGVVVCGFVVGDVGSAVVFSLYLYVLEHWSASRASYGLVIIPVVTIFLSVWLDDERLGPSAR